MNVFKELDILEKSMDKKQCECIQTVINSDLNNELIAINSRINDINFWF